MNRETETGTVLTLAEAAEFLRLQVRTIERLAREGEIPGRHVEGEWRFLSSALADWLAHRDQRSILLRQAGALADDESLAELRSQIYAARGRPEVDQVP